MCLGRFTDELPTSKSAEYVGGEAEKLAAGRDNGRSDQS